MLISLLVATPLLYGLLLKDWAISRYYIYRLTSNMPQMNDQETVDYARELIHSNTVHLPLGNGDPRTTSDQIVILRGIYHNEELVATTCGPRAQAMRTILEALDFEVRTIHLFTDDYDAVDGHTFIEVKVDDSWQTQDPDFNVYYIDRWGNRANTREILTGLAQPVDGWVKYQDTEIPLHAYFEILMYDNRPGASLMVVDPGRFDLEKYFPINEVTFPDYAQIYGEIEWQTLSQ